MLGGLPFAPKPRQCPCRHCMQARDRSKPFFEREEMCTFIVCPKCGNKRCPHANSHKYPCSGSNDSGQVGSAYP